MVILRGRMTDRRKNLCHIGFETTAADHAVNACRGTGGIRGGRAGIIVWIIIIVDPLKDIARHIQKAIETLAIRMSIDRASMTAASFEIGKIAGWAVIAPWIFVPIRAACSLLPLSLSRQLTTNPLTIGIGRVPRHAGNGIIAKLGGAIRRRANLLHGGAAVSARYTLGIHFVCNFGLLNPIAIERKSFGRRIAITKSHDELARWNVNKYTVIHPRHGCTCGWSSQRRWRKRWYARWRHRGRGWLGSWRQGGWG